MKITKRSLVLLILNIVLPPLLGNNNLFGINIQMINKLILFLCPALFICSFLWDCLKFKKLKIDLLFIALSLTALSMLISIIFGVIININTLTNFITYIYILGFIYAIHMYEFDKKDLKIILISILSIFLIVSLIGIVQYIFRIDIISRGIQKYPGALGRIKSTMSIATILDKYLTFNLILILYLIYKTNSKKPFLFLTCLIGIFALSFTYSRTGIFCFYVVAFLFIILCSFKKQFTNALVILLIAIVLYLLPGQKYVLSSIANYGNNVLNSIYDKLNIDFLSPITNNVANWFIINPNENKSTSNSQSKVDNTTTESNSQSQITTSSKDEKEQTFRDDSIASRSAYRAVATALIKEYPLTGIGIGNYNHIYKNQNVNNYLKNDIELKGKYLYPHNLYLHFGAEVGLIGLVLLMFSFIVMLADSFKRKNILLPALFFILFCLFNFTESLLYMKDIAFWFIIVYSLITQKNAELKKVM